MRGFLKQLVVFLLPLLVAAGALLVYNCPRQFQYLYLKDDCSSKGAWMYSRLYEQKNPANIVFIGTSRMLRAVNDSLLEAELNASGLPLRVLNAGHCRIGRDLETVLGEDVMDQVLDVKPGSCLVIEVHEKEGVAPHPVFYCLARPHDYLLPESFVNQQYFSTIYDAGLLRLQFVRNNIWQPQLPAPKKSNGSSRFGYFETDHLADVKELEESAARCASVSNEAPGSWENFELRYSKAWLERLAAKAKARNCPVHFLFLPPYGCRSITPREMTFYQQYGDVWLAPDSIFSKKENWSDHDHFNTAGGRELTDWLALKIGEAKSR